MMAMQPKTEINIGIDNATTVQIGNAIIEHQIQKEEAKLYGGDGSLRLGGNISKLHRPSPFKRIWALAKNGDMCFVVVESTLAKGPRAITVTKAKGHATQELVDEGRIDEEHKKGNDGADDGASKGAEDEQQHRSTVARKYASRQ